MMKIKNSYNLIIIVLLLVVSTACNDDLCQLDLPYPRVYTHEVEYLGNSNMRFTAEIYRRVNAEIVEYGFVVTRSFVPEIDNSYRTIRGNGVLMHDHFSLEEFIEAPNPRMRQFNVTAFVKTEKYIVYGNKVSLNIESQN